MHFQFFYLTGHFSFLGAQQRTFWYNLRNSFHAISYALAVPTSSFQAKRLQFVKIVTSSRMLFLKLFMRHVSLLCFQHVLWCFSDSDMRRSFDVIVQLPAVNVVKLPVYVELDIPSVISVQSSTTVIYTIHNRSDSLQDFDVIVESSDAFMFAGHRQVSVIHCT